MLLPQYLTQLLLPVGLFLSIPLPSGSLLMKSETCIFLNFEPPVSGSVLTMPFSR